MYTPKTSGNAKQDKHSLIGDLHYFWQTCAYDPITVNYHDIIHENPVLDAVLSATACITWIKDLRRLQFDYISSNIRELWGYSPRQFLTKNINSFSSIIHPHDGGNIERLQRLVWNFLITLPPEKRHSFKFSLDYRLRKADNTYLRILEQNTVLQVDQAGNITHLIGVCSDITTWKKSEHRLSTLVCFDGGTISLPTIGEHLSTREIEIIKLMAAGYNSKAIAHQLHISIHTVNTHRQHMYVKTHTKNASELVQFANDIGLI